jgi:acetyl esterase/lipase
MRMKNLARAFVSMLSYAIFILGAVHLLRVRSTRWFALRTIKSLSQALAPSIALVGVGNVILAGVLRLPLAGLAAGAGVLLSIRFIQRIIQHAPAFDTAFGPDWQQRLTEQLSQDYQAAMLKQKWAWNLPASTLEPDFQTGIVYYTVAAEGEGSDINLHCDLWRPALTTAPTGLAIIYVHGGGYFTSRKDFGTRPFFRHLARQGHTIMDIDYRLAPQANLLDMLSDLLHAVAWMKANGERLGINPERIVLAGGSAGAHLALMAAYAHGNPHLTPPDLQGTDLSVRAVVSYYGILDMAATYASMQRFFAGAAPSKPMPESLLHHPLARWATGLGAWVRGVDPASMQIYARENNDLLRAGLEASMRALIGGKPDEVPTVYDKVSPLYHAGPHCPPTLLIQGEHDYILPNAALHALDRKLRAANVPVVTIELPATEHTFDLFLPQYSPPAQTALYHLDRFLALMM